ncbi:hypothetical protein [Methanosarcina sp. UBA5]|uniref:hypothetical protein n=1 Tax=Methanosarcina sp. UBA5 TaxID=1915593 RepID=UPI0025DC3233|nr:hypothetical protein [Methanosarcina sp. UBA5]
MRLCAVCGEFDSFATNIESLWSSTLDQTNPELARDVTSFTKEYYTRVLGV